MKVQIAMKTLKLGLWLAVAVVMAAVVMGVPGLGAGQVSAQSCSPRWLNYDVVVDVLPSGQLRVTEDWVMELGGVCREGFASISRQNTTGLTIVSVRDEGGEYVQGVTGSGEPYRYGVLYGGDYVEVVWNLPQLPPNSQRAFTLVYTVDGAIRINDEGDALQWIAIPPDLGAVVENATVTVNLPSGAQILEAPESIGVGTEWVTANSNDSVTFTATQAFRPSGDGLAVRVVFTHGVVPSVKPPWQDSIEQAEFFNRTVRPLINLGLVVLGLALTVGGPAVMYVLWFAQGRDPKIEGVPEFITEPPDDLDPGLVGVLFDEHVNPQDVTATLMQLAAKGYVEIEERETPGAFETVSKEIVMRKAEHAPATLDGLAEYERKLYMALMGNREETSLSRRVSATAYGQILQVQNAMYQEMVRRGYFKGRPDKVRNMYIGAATNLMGIMFFFGFGFMAYTDGFGLGGWFICPVIGLVVTLVSIAVAGRYMPARTKEGARQAALWKAFYTYLSNIQKFADMENVADQFEKYLPYAVAFGLERRFTLAFSQVQNTPVMMPAWYRVRRLGPVGSGGRVLGEATRPQLNTPGGGVVGGLNQMGASIVSSLNSIGTNLNTPPKEYSGGGSRGRSGGGSFRSGGGFRGSSGGGARGFR